MSFFSSHFRALQCSIEGHFKYIETITTTTTTTHLTNDHFKNEFNLLKLIFETSINKNRHIREQSFYVINSLLTNNKIIKLNEINLELISKHLACGLSDNWSQVRLAASISTRNFCLNYVINEENENKKEVYLKHLLPSMCLNRYYLAEGVQTYSQQSWTIIFQTNGRLYVEKYLSFVIDYYLKQINVTNTITKETTCACIGELFTKIDKIKLKSYLNELYNVLIECFECESWTVQDG